MWALPILYNTVIQAHMGKQLRAAFLHCGYIDKPTQISIHKDVIIQREIFTKSVYQTKFTVQRRHKRRIKQIYRPEQIDI
jgi:hypothetical protein